MSSNKEFLTNFGEYISIYKLDDKVILHDYFNDFEANFKIDDLDFVMNIFNNIEDEFPCHNFDTVEDEDIDSYEVGDLDYEDIHIGDEYGETIKGNWVILGRCGYIFDALDLFKKKYDKIDSLKALLKKYKEVRNKNGR